MQKKKKKLSGIGMDGNGYAASSIFIIILIIFIHISDASSSSVHHIRKLASDNSKKSNTTSPPPQVAAPAGSPVNESNSNLEKQKEKGSPMSSEINNSSSNDNKTSPIAAAKESKINDSNDKNNSSNAGGEKGADKKGVDGKIAPKANTTTQLIRGSGCEHPIISCRDKEMLACVEAAKDGPKKLFLVVTNEGERTLKVNVNLPDSLENAVPTFEVRKHKTKKVDISTMGKVAELLVNAGNAKCVLPLVNPVSVENFMRQISFYSKQVTPIYAAYAFFLLVLLSGGTWACCRLRKRRSQDGIAYQELEMGLPESASAGNVPVEEGWDHDWDDDDWDEDSALKSPGGNQVRNISADGLTSRSTKKDGWEDWED